jgi:hypothetical protein
MIGDLLAGIELTLVMVIGTDCIGSYKSNYHTVNAFEWRLRFKI